MPGPRLNWNLTIYSSSYCRFIRLPKGICFKLRRYALGYYPLFSTSTTESRVPRPDVHRQVCEEPISLTPTAYNGEVICKTKTVYPQSHGTPTGAKVRIRREIGHYHVASPAVAPAIIAIALSIYSGDIFLAPARGRQLNSTVTSEETLFTYCAGPVRDPVTGVIIMLRRPRRLGNRMRVSCLAISISRKLADMEIEWLTNSSTFEFVEASGGRADIVCPRRWVLHVGLRGTARS